MSAAANPSKASPATIATRKPRLWRFLGADGHCLDVAIDHGFFNEHSFLTSIEDMEAVVRTIVDAQPDAVQLSPGQAHLLQRIPSHKPGLVLRTDVANVYGSPPPPHLFSELIEDAVLQAVRLDASCVCVNLLKVDNHPESDRLYQQCVRNIMKLKVDCDHYAMPLMVEPLCMRMVEGQKYGVNGSLKDMLPLIRQAVELGADVIKCDPCDDPREFHQVPVLVRGGGKAPEAELFARTAELMRQGASGLVYGRNIIQHANPRGITKALMACVHDRASPEQAMHALKTA